MTTPAVRVKDAKASVGCPRSSFQIHFYDFSKLATTTDHYVASPKFTCNGHHWLLAVYPGGNNRAAEGNVSVKLKHLTEGTITVRYGIRIANKFGKIKKAKTSVKRVFTADTNLGSPIWGWDDFISRSEIWDESQSILDDNGTLTIDVFIEEEPTTIFVPNNPLVKMIQGMFNDQTTADVCFEVSSSGEKEDNDGIKRAKTTTPFYAHRLILETCAPMLAALCGSNDSGGVVTASIDDVKPEIFSHLLSYVCGGNVPEKELKTNAKDIIDAADKYSIVNLKLEAEAAYVKSTDISLDNAMDNLLYADSMNLALLKETVMDFLAENSVEATEKVSFANFPGHLSKDIFVAMNKVHGKCGGDDAFAAMSVSELRKKLDEKGLEVDGSREAMIESIKSHE